MTLAEELATTVISCLDKATNKYCTNVDRITELEAALTDLQHEIEFTSFDVIDVDSELNLWDVLGFYQGVIRGYRYAKRLQELRQERRKLKDENETLWYLHDFVQKNAGMKAGVCKALSHIKSKEASMQDRIYYPRSNEDLPGIVRMRELKVVEG